jgi:hypothetical protein
MDRATIEKAIAVILTEIHSRLKEAARIAKAAEACALAGSIAEGVEVSMEIEQILYEAGRLQDAAAGFSNGRDRNSALVHHFACLVVPAPSDVTASL